MRSLPNLRTFQSQTGKGIQICLAPPHNFILQHQRQLLPDWNVPISHLILLLQQSAISLSECNPKVAAEKNNLRAKFISFGCNLIVALQAQGHKGDLFDPRTGYPLYTSQGKLTLDDNAVVKALLNYPVVGYQNCSLLTHPIWNNHVYPGTIAVSAPQKLVESLLEQEIINQKWTMAVDGF
ncbi:MAG: methylmalonic aciduria and homocystinuria type D protein [Waterburya sp.]